MDRYPADRYDLLFRLTFRTYFTGLKGPKEDMKELLAYMKEEYQSFATRYGDTIRQPGTDNLGPWLQEDNEPRPWAFYLAKPFDGKMMEQRFQEIEALIEKKPS